MLAAKEHIRLLETANNAHREIVSFERAKDRVKQELSGLLSEVEIVKKRKHDELTTVDELGVIIKRLKDDRTTIEYDVQQLRTQYATTVSEVEGLDQKKCVIRRDIEKLESDIMKLNDAHQSAQVLHAAQHTHITTEMEHLNTQFATMNTLKAQRAAELEHLTEQYELTKSVLSKIGDQLKKVSE
jgi:chromosome segregation ATPase